MDTATVTMTIHLPRILVQQYSAVRDLEEVLRGLRIWPADPVSHTWHIDPVTAGYLVELVVDVPLAPLPGQDTL